VFTPKATLEEERVIRAAWETTIKEKFEGPVEIHLVYTPKETIIHIIEAPHSASTLKGDIDNYVKLTLDALNGAAWEDDGQVVRITAVKTDLAKENWSSHQTGE
jgi:Holliday junction resolvase RusA-like endonuclease